MSHYYHDYDEHFPHWETFNGYKIQNIALEQVSTSSAEPVTLEEAKDFFREDRSVEDGLINSLVISARENIESYTGYKLTETEFKLHLDGFYNIKIPVFPYIEGSVSIKYFDADNTEQTLSSSKYTVYSQAQPVEIEYDDENLPNLYDDIEQSDNRYPVYIQFKAGYGTKATDVPEYWKTAIKLLAMIYHRRMIPENDRQNINPFNIAPLKFLFNDKIRGRFK